MSEAAFIPTSTLQEDLRRARRQRVRKSGKIVFAEGRTVLDCTVEDISPIGARVRLAGRSALPTYFALLIAGQDTALVCRLVWQHGTDAGVRFLDA